MSLVITHSIGQGPILHIDTNDQVLVVNNLYYFQVCYCLLRKAFVSFLKYLKIDEYYNNNASN